MPSDRPRRRIPEATVARLPVYLRILAEQADEQVDSISSDRLAELAGVNAAKVRKDLSYLGSYGTRGVGYEVQYLVYQIRRELGLTHDWPVVIVGAGNLGQALAGYGLMWNTRYLKANNLPEPKEWADLVKPVYFGHLAISSPSRSGTTHLTVETIL